MVIKELRVNPAQAKGRVARDGLAGLKESIEKSGVLQPIIVLAQEGERPMIVDGHRRAAAAELAGLKEIRAVVISDPIEAGIAHVVANIHSLNLTPMQEADQYEQLRKVHPNLEAMASYVGRPASHVASRMTLLRLPASARKELESGELALGVALAIARTPDTATREEAAKFIIERPYLMSDARRASEFIQQHYMLSLKEAPFDTEDLTLVEAAGPCSKCPKRSGNATLLFPDMKDGNRCTDPGCFKAKSVAAFTLKAASAEAKGLKVLKAKEAIAELDGRGQKYVELDDQGDYDTKGSGTWKQRLGKIKVEPSALAQHPRTGAAVTLYDHAALRALLGARKAKGNRQSSDESRRRKEAKLKAELAREFLKATATPKKLDELEALRVIVARAHERAGNEAFRLIEMQLGEAQVRIGGPRRCWMPAPKRSRPQPARSCWRWACW